MAPDENETPNVSGGPTQEEEEVTLTEQQIRAEMPALKDIKVIYLGPEHNFSIAFRGRIAIETYEGHPEKRTVAAYGTSSYDFSTHSAVGQLIRNRLRPDNAPQEERGRSWCIVEHPEHLRRFLRMRGPRGENIFKVVGPRSQMELLEEYITRRERHLRQQQLLTETVITGAA